jgi:outer membrane protein assembly factor BamB
MASSYAVTLWGGEHAPTRERLPKGTWTMGRTTIRCAVGFVLSCVLVGVSGSEEWTQLKFDALHSGDAAGRHVTLPLGLVGAVPLTDAVFTSPVVAQGRVFVVDGSGVAFCFDAATLKELWRFSARGGKTNCNNVSSPALVGDYLHFGTTAGYHYVLNAADGSVAAELDCGEPIFAAPVAANGRVYVFTLGTHVYALEPDGTVCWTWDFLKECRGFEGDRWSGADWLQYKQARVGAEDRFCCSRNAAVYGKTLVIPAGGRVVWLEDTGAKPVLRGSYDSRYNTMALSVGADGSVYRQWHFLDNLGSVARLRLRDNKVARDEVPGTTTSSTGSGSLSFSSVSLRGDAVYRCRPEEGFGLCRHTPGQEAAERLGGFPSIAAPVLLDDAAVYGALDGRLYVVPLTGDGEVWSFKTAFDRAITAPVAVCDGRVYFGCDDGYLYVLGPDGRVALPSKQLGLDTIRSPLTGALTDPRYNRYTSWRNWSNTDADDQGLKPPFRLAWIRRFCGSAKHFSTFGGGRMYTHTAEGQIFAVEQETGRLLWRVYSPGVHISYTSPLYHDERLLVPQAGFERCRLRCLDAATGKLVWEAPFAGSPSWNRQMPPVVYRNLAIYMFSTGKYGADAPAESDEKIDWLFGHQDNPRFPSDQRPLVRAFNATDGAVAWTKDFSEYGSGGDDADLCLMGDTLYYSCYFGHSPSMRRGKPGPRGITAALDPLTGEVRWLTTDYFVHGGCTVSGKDGRLYLGGYNKIVSGNSVVWCLDAKTGQLVWQSDPLSQSIKVVIVGAQFLFTHSQYEHGYVLDKATGKIINSDVTQGYKCTAFTLSGHYLLGANMDVHDFADPRSPKLLATGPRLDPSECIGAVVSNGRIYYTGQGGGLQTSLVWGDEASGESQSGGRGQ